MFRNRYKYKWWIDFWQKCHDNLTEKYNFHKSGAKVSRLLFAKILLKELNPYFALYTKINLKWNIKFSINLELLEGGIGEKISSSD